MKKEGSMSRRVDAEIRNYLKRNPRESTHSFFNNFDGNLPGGYRTSYSANNLGSVDNDARASERLRGQTGYEFLAECRSALLEAGFTDNEIIEARQRHRENSRDEEALKNLTAILRATYIVLRMRGYKHYPDLTG